MLILPNATGVVAGGPAAQLLIAATSKFHTVNLMITLRQGDSCNTLAIVVLARAVATAVAGTGLPSQHLERVLVSCHGVVCALVHTNAQGNMISTLAAIAQVVA